MISKYNPLISNNQRNTCGECYVNKVKDTFTLTNILDSNVCIPKVINDKCLQVTPPDGIPQYWTALNEVPFVGIIPTKGNSFFYNSGYNAITYLSIKESTPSYDSYITLVQRVTLEEFICGEYHKARFYIDGKFLNTSGSISLEIKDTSGDVVFSQINVKDEIEICFKSTDTVFDIYVTIDILDYWTINKPAQYVLYKIQLCEVVTKYSNIINETFNDNSNPIKKYNVINNGSTFCGGTQSTISYIDYKVDSLVPITGQYCIDLIIDSGIPASSTLTIHLLDKDFLFVSNNYFSINGNEDNQHIHLDFSATDETMYIRLFFWTADENICLKSLWVSDCWDSSDLSLDTCNGSGDMEVVCDCNSLSYIVKNLYEGESGYLQVNGNKYYFENEYCNEVIGLKYYNDCLILTDEGDYIFQKDENDNILSQQIFFNGFVFGISTKNEDGYQFSPNKFLKKRSFAKSIYERDIEINDVPEEFVYSLSLALMCRYVWIDLGNGLWQEVYTNDNAQLDITPNEFGTVDIKFTVYFGGIISSSCNC